MIKTAAETRDIARLRAFAIERGGLPLESGGAIILDWLMKQVGVSTRTRRRVQSGISAAKSTASAIGHLADLFGP